MVQLRALDEQDCDWFEVIVVDDASTDNTVAAVRSSTVLEDRLRIIELNEPVGPAAARNRAAREARGGWLLFCDSDDEVHTSWVRAMCVALGACELVTGLLDESILNDASLRSPTRGPLIRPAIFDGFGFLPFAMTANLGVTAELFSELGGFDENFRSAGGEDVDFCWRAQLNGVSLELSEEAIVNYRLQQTLAASAVQSFRHARSVPNLFAKYRDLGMARRTLRQTLLSWLWLVCKSWYLLMGAAARGRWVRHLAVNLGRLAGSVQARVLYI